MCKYVSKSWPSMNSCSTQAIAFLSLSSHTLCFWSPPWNVLTLSLPPSPQSSYAYHKYFIIHSKSLENWDRAFKKIQIIVGLASPTSSISLDLLLASVMRLRGGCQTLNVTEIKFSWWGWSQRHSCLDYGASWLSSLVSVPLCEHTKA